MEVPPKQLSVRFGSYPSGRCGQPRVPKPRGHRPTQGGSASIRAVTRVNPEQASKVMMRMPTRLSNGEGRRAKEKQPTRASFVIAGVMGVARVKGSCTQRGRPDRVRGCDSRRRIRRRPGRESERLVVPGKPGNAGGGKGPHFGVLSMKPRRRRLA